MNNDIFDSGTPKYSTATDIYDALCEMTKTEESGILGEMFADVSYEGQDYYYTDKGAALKERFEESCDYGDKMWLMELAAWQLGDDDVHDLVFEALNNPDMAKRLGFKKLFIDNMLSGDKSNYDEIADAYLYELRELNRFDFWDMVQAFDRVIEERDGQRPTVPPYPNLARAVYRKAKGLQLHEERQLIAECRALLTSYDDFMLGLKMNQELYTALERQHNARMQALRAGYEDMVKQLLLAAQEQGVNFILPEASKALKEGHTDE